MSMSATTPKPTSPGRPTYRLSVSLTPQQHHQLSEIARKNRVSAAWVVREAIERLLQHDRPLVQVDQA